MKHGDYHPPFFLEPKKTHCLISRIKPFLSFLILFKCWDKSQTNKPSRSPMNKRISPPTRQDTKIQPSFHLKRLTNTINPLSLSLSLQESEAAGKFLSKIFYFLANFPRLVIWITCFRVLKIMEKGCKLCEKYKEHCYQDHLNGKAVEFYELMHGDFSQHVVIIFINFRELMLLS